MSSLPLSNTTFFSNFNSYNNLIVNKRSMLNTNTFDTTDSMLFNFTFFIESVETSTTISSANVYVLNFFNLIINVFTFSLLVLFIYTSLNFLFLTQSNKNYLNITKIFIYNCLSKYEILSVSTAFFFILISSVVVSSVEDDLIDFLSFFLLIFIILTLFLFSWSLGFIKFYYIINSATNSQGFFKIILDDIVNTILCVLRIVLCWFRYIFYDLQVEFVDLVLFYTEDVNINFNSNILIFILSTSISIFITILLILICFFKFLVALFLMWLVVDLFLLRSGFNSTESWLFFKCASIIKSNSVKNKLN